MSKFYITTPIYYVNAKPHIGHSYTQVACDALARYHRQERHDVFFLTGTDEHGEKIEKATIEAGLKEGQEKDFVDSIVPVFKDLWKTLGIRYDGFIRTTDERHIKCVRAVLDKLHKDGRIYRKDYKGWFCTPCETFWSESQSPDGTCPDCKRPLEKLDESNYFLKISDQQKWLIGHINANPGFIRPDFRRNEVLGFLNNEELHDLCISRPKSRMGWGVEVPFDPDYVTYVWFDALINYISGIGYADEPERFARLWPADVHVIGKDIIRHHAVYWPIMCRLLGIAVPRMIFAHGWWVIKGEKMSKSKGNVVDPSELVKKYGIDPYRYFLLREVQFGSDGAFSEEALISRYNSDLANDLGNLLNRTLTMAQKYFGGSVPPGSRSSLSPKGEELKARASALGREMEKAMPELDFLKALAAIWEAVGLANKYIEDSKPWTLAKEARTAELAGVIYNLLETIRISAICLYPFMPSTAQSIWGQLGLDGEVDSAKPQESAVWGSRPEGSKVRSPQPLFPRIEQA